MQARGKSMNYLPTLSFPSLNGDNNRYNEVILKYYKVFFQFIYLFLMFIFERERERECKQAGEEQRERETQNLKQAPGSALSEKSLMFGSNPRIRDDDQS